MADTAVHPTRLPKMLLITDMPPEILELIARRVRRWKDLAFLSRTNKQMHSVVNPVLYARAAKHRREGARALLWAAAEGHTAALEGLLKLGANPGSIASSLSSRNRTVIGGPSRRHQIPRPPESHSTWSDTDAWSLASVPAADLESLVGPDAAGGSQLRFLARWGAGSRLEWDLDSNSDLDVAAVGEGEESQSETESEPGPPPPPAPANGTTQGGQASDGDSISAGPDLPDGLAFYWTAIHEAVARNDKKAVEILLAHGARIDGTARGFCDCGRPDDNQGFRVNPPPFFVPEWTPLHTAICHGHDDMAEMLLDRGASLKVGYVQLSPGLQGQNFAWNLGANTERQSLPIYAIHVAAWKGALGVAKLLVEKYHPLRKEAQKGGTGAGVNGSVEESTPPPPPPPPINLLEVKDPFGKTPLGYAIDTGHMSTVGAYLLDKGANPNGKTSTAWGPARDGTPLTALCGTSQFEEAWSLLQRGGIVFSSRAANVQRNRNDQGTDAAAALRWCCYTGTTSPSLTRDNWTLSRVKVVHRASEASSEEHRVKVVRELLSHGVDPYEVPNPLSAPVPHPSMPGGGSPFLCAAVRHNTPVVRVLLEAKTLEPSVVYRNCADALLVALGDVDDEAAIEVSTLLLDYMDGVPELAPAEARDVAWFDMLYQLVANMSGDALSLKKLDLMRRLLSTAAASGVDVAAKDDLGRPLIAMCAEYQLLEACQLLAKYGFADRLTISTVEHMAERTLYLDNAPYLAWIMDTADRCGCLNRQRLLATALRKHSYHAANLLLDRGVRPTFEADERGFTVVHHMCSELYERDSKDADRIEQGRTALQRVLAAAGHGKRRAARLVNQRSAEGLTPAVYLVQFYYDNGLPKGRERCPNKKVWDQQNADTNHEQVIGLLAVLLDFGADLHIEDPYRRVLRHAVKLAIHRRKHLLLRAILKASPPPDAEVAAEYLFMACNASKRIPSPDVLLALLDTLPQDANSADLLNARNARGETPLFMLMRSFATARNCDSPASASTEAGVEAAEIRSGTSRTPRVWGRCQCYNLHEEGAWVSGSSAIARCVELLVSHGASWDAPCRSGNGSGAGGGKVTTATTPRAVAEAVVRRCQDAQRRKLRGERQGQWQRRRLLGKPRVSDDEDENRDGGPSSRPSNPPVLRPSARAGFPLDFPHGGPPPRVGPPLPGAIADFLNGFAAGPGPDLSVGRGFPYPPPGGFNGLFGPPRIITVPRLSPRSRRRQARRRRRRPRRGRNTSPSTSSSSRSSSSSGTRSRSSSPHRCYTPRPHATGDLARYLEGRLQLGGV